MFTFASHLLRRRGAASPNCIRGALLLSLLGWIAPSSAAAKSGPVQRLGLGVAAGATTGFGLSARLRMQRGVALNITGMPFFDAREYGGSFGLQGTMDLMTHKGLSLYALLGTQAFLTRRKYAEPFRQERFERRYDSLVVGSGLGVELKNGRFAFTFDVALAGVFALTPSTYLRYLGRVNVGVFPNLAACIYLGPGVD